jgi:hypothetical protein
LFSFAVPQVYDGRGSLIGVGSHFEAGFRSFLQWQIGPPPGANVMITVDEQFSSFCCEKFGGFLENLPML